MLVTIAMLGASVAIFTQFPVPDFYNSLPDKVRQEIDLLRKADQDDSPRAIEIYAQYWDGDLLFGERWALLIGLLVCLPFGLATGFWVSRLVTLPLDSMAEAANASRSATSPCVPSPATRAARWPTWCATSTT